MFQNYIAGDIKAININIQEAVFAIVLEHGGEKEVCVPSVIRKLKLTSYTLV